MMASNRYDAVFTASSYVVVGALALVSMLLLLLDMQTNFGREGPFAFSLATLVVLCGETLLIGMAHIVGHFLHGRFTLFRKLHAACAKNSGPLGKAADLVVGIGLCALAIGFFIAHYPA
jgi:hypothetical protein